MARGRPKKVIQLSESESLVHHELAEKSGLIKPNAPMNLVYVKDMPMVRVVEDIPTPDQLQEMIRQATHLGADVVLNGNVLEVKFVRNDPDPEEKDNYGKRVHFEVNWHDGIRRIREKFRERGIKI